MFACALFVAACGAAQSEGISVVEANTPAQPEVTGPSPLAVPARAPGPLTRLEARALVAAGLGSVLSRVELEPVLRGNEFVGFRLVDAQDFAAWRAAGADLRPGDVIVRVNGVRVERPEQGLWAFERLRVVPEVVVELLREGTPVTVRSPILETASAAPANAGPAGNGSAGSAPGVAPPSSGGSAPAPVTGPAPSAPTGAAANTPTASKAR